jgi:hypothetical protein
MNRYLDSNGDGKPDLALPMPEPAAVAPMGGRVGDSADARNRALRTLLWGLLTDVGVAVLLYLLPIFGTMSTDWSTLDWRVIGISLAKTVVMAALSFLARRFKISPRTTTI